MSVGGARLEVLTASESVRKDLRAWAGRLGHPREPEAPGEGDGEIRPTIHKRKDASRP